MTPPLAETRAARRRERRRSRVRAVAAGAAVVLVAAGGTLAWQLTRDEPAPERGATPTTVAPTTTTDPAPDPATVATTKVGDLTAYESPVEGAPSLASLSGITEYGFARTLLVTEQRSGWLQVLLPIRPNEATGWVRESDVTLSETTMEIRVELAAHRLVLLDAGQVVLEAPTVNGKAETPTPLGHFYVTDPVDLTDRPNGAYGAFAIGISAYSEVLLEFNGGPGQVAIHGTTNPGELGQDISNGCVRVTNDVILELARQAPLGTPVTIAA